MTAACAVGGWAGPLALDRLRNKFDRSQQCDDCLRGDGNGEGGGVKMTFGMGR